MNEEARDLLCQVEERRKDLEFMKRLDRIMRDDAEVLDKLAADERAEAIPEARSEAVVWALRRAVASLAEETERLWELLREVAEWIDYMEHPGPLAQATRAKIEAAIRAAHPEADRAPGQRERDRALNDYMAEHGPNAQRRRRDAERREADQARDDTVTLTEVEKAAMDYTDQWPECRLCKAWTAPDEFKHKPGCLLARFGAGRAEDEPPPAKDPTQ